MLCDPSFAAPFDHGPQAGAVDEADVHLAAHVRGEQTLQILEGHSGGQRFECYGPVGVGCAGRSASVKPRFANLTSDRAECRSPYRSSARR